MTEMRATFLEWLTRRSPDLPVEFVETHVSILGFQGDRVYKLKKAVAFPFVDLSTPERRFQNCVREVALNRRFAPDVYLGVAAVTDDHHNVIDHVVEMRRLPADRRLAGLARAEDDTAAHCLARVAESVERAHVRAARGPEIDAAATPGAISALWARELAETQPFLGAVLDPGVASDAARLAARYVEGRGALFEMRIAAGRVCDGHGDLLAEDVYCLDDGPRLLDCLEFDDRLRWGDVLADIAFLAMDLERLGRADLGRAFLDRYRRAAHDDWPDSLAHFYIAYRAHVRAKVACLRHAQGDDAAARTAADLLALARRHLDTGRIRLVLVGGPPGTGKSTIGRGICDATGWHLIRSDVVRKELAGLESEVRSLAPIDRGLYTAEWNARTYDTMLRRARRLLAMGTSTVLDASWTEPSQRQAAERVAAANAADFDAVRCDSPVEIAAARTGTRRHDASDARPEIARAIAARFAPWPGSFTLDTAGTSDNATAAALDYLGASSGRQGG